MCGIAGVVGRPGAARLVHQALAALEYRGYDSCGVAWHDGRLHVARRIGPVAGLQVPAGTEAIALGHTRWATHGGVTEANAHPHLDCKGKIAVVHNGVLLNHAQLRDRLRAAGHHLASETDSEALAHLWEDADGDGLDCLRALRGHLQGTYSIAILDGAALYVAKQRNPLWVATADGVAYLASDPIALRAHVPAAIPLEDGDHGVLRAGGLELFDHAGRPIRRSPLALEQADDRPDKAGYEHFMLKEIHETPSALNRLLATHVRQQRPYVDIGIKRAELARVHRVLTLGAGTSHHAGLLAALHLQRLAKIPAEAKATPEFKDDPAIPEPGTLLVAMSQSGETLDTMQALHRLRSHPAKVLAVTNQAASSLARQADYVLALQAGTEISVAATKTFLCQALLGHLLALAKAGQDRAMTDAALAHAAQELLRLPRAVDRTLARSADLANLARGLVPHESAFILAKGLLLPVAMEAALKLKEIAYQHAEAYPAGELKHGPFALLTAETGVVFLLQQGANEDSVLNSIQEVKARGADVFVVAMEGSRNPGLDDGRVVWLPAAENELAPVVFGVAMHLLSYWVAKGRALPIDRPRNLAKSVTVE